MKIIFPSAFLLAFLIIGRAPATNNHPIGARSAAMGNASVALSDVWSLYHNQAGLAHLKKVETGFYYENRFLVPELSVKGIALAIPVKSGVFGATATHYGFSLYSETKAGLAYAQSFGEKISAGLQLNYLNTFIGEGYGNKTMVTAEFGFMAELADGLSIGAHIYNPSRAKVSEYANERVPTIMRLGLNYKLSEKALICAETIKDTNHKPGFRAGMEYQVVEQVFLRAGISTNPAMNTFGIGFNLKHVKIDFASSINSVLGYSPQIGLNYTF